MTATAEDAGADCASQAPTVLARVVDAWRSRRDKILTNPAFLDWSLRFPLTRPIARARTRALFDLCAGFVFSQILLACVRLGIFEHLARAPDTVEGLSERLDLSPEATRHLLDGATGLRLLERRGDRYGLGPLGGAVVAAPGVAAMIEHHALLYADLADPVAVLRRRSEATRLTGYWSYATHPAPAALDRDRTHSYTGLMAASQPMVSAEILAAIRFDSHRCLLDVGGGDGAFLAAVADAAPSPRLVLFDLPAVAARAADRFDASGLSHRATAIGGDFHTDPLPAGADIVTLVRVLHDHDDESVRHLLRAVRAALPAGGKVIVAEPMLAVPGAESVGAYFAFYLHAMGQGRPRTQAEIAAFLAEAGFARTRSIPTRSPVITAIVEGC
jgi:demethylspheroidene O-methyltransferase